MRTPTALFLGALLAGCGNDIELAKEGNLEPAADILSPDEGAVVTDRDAVDFQATIADGNGLDDVASVLWESSIDGPIGAVEDAVPDVNGISRVQANLSPGTHAISLTVTDLAGAQAVDTLSLIVERAAQDPTAEITSPTDFATFFVGDLIPMIGGVSDPQQDAATLAVVWSVEPQGESPLILPSVPPSANGTTSATWEDAPIGTHVLFLTATDADGNQTIDSVAVTVTDPGSIDADADGWSVNAGDCDDADGSVHPGTVDLCGNAVDDDCSGFVDDKDLDSDLHVDDACDGTNTSLLPADDCDDSSAATHPGAPESLDGEDNDCDGAVDDGTTAFDNDGDCFCVGPTCVGSFNAACAVLDVGDCDDSDPTLNPADADLDGLASCDGDCDDADPGLNLDDADGDGWSTCDGDCDDADPNLDPADVDGDGYSACDGDCNDFNPDINPGDGDGDGVSACDGDCDDTTALVFPGAVDVPDGFYVDDDCDGIDGHAATAAFVTPAGTDAGLCTQAAPCRTVGFAMAVADTQGWSDVYLQAGSYAGVVTLVDGVNLYGGFNAAWARAPYSQGGHLVTLTGGTYDEGAGAGGNQYVVLRARTVNAKVADLVVDAPDAVGSYLFAGKSSYGLHQVGGFVTLERVSVLGGNGSAGTVGASGAAASALAASSGGTGSASVEDAFAVCATSRSGGGSGASNATCSARTAGGAGGSSGTQDTSCGWTGLCSSCSAQSGLGGNNAGISGAGYGTGGVGGGTCGGFVGAGLDGVVTNGTGGAGGTGRGALTLNYWFGNAGLSGAAGLDGTGGGGGGGSGGCDSGTDDKGASGGGGGAGGCAGSPGGGGGGGGSSFGAFVASGTLTVTNSSFTRGNAGSGGTGGSGGAGQPGGPGGNGGAGTTDASSGGNGGDGAPGGAGGGGGGGAGGLTYGIYSMASFVSQLGNSFSGPLSGGAGGSGGSSSGTVGSLGGAGASGDVGTCASASGC
jgi:hypothetical protein